MHLSWSKPLVQSQAAPFCPELHPSILFYTHPVYSVNYISLNFAWTLSYVVNNFVCWESLFRVSWLGMITSSWTMHPELNCRNRSFGWDCSLKFCYTFFSPCTVIVVGVNEVDIGIGDKGIFEKYRITNMIRQWYWRRRLFGPSDNEFEMG